MIRNYIKIAWRNLMKNKTYSLLNIVGLAAGLTCFSLIALWVNDELSFDRFNTKADRIVRLVGQAKTESGTTESAVSSAPMAAALMKDYPEVEEAVRLDLREEIIQLKQEQVLQPGILLTDPSFFKVFSYSLSKGDINTVLNKPYSIVLTESLAKKYFGNEDAIGQKLTIFMLDRDGRGAQYTVTGIMPDQKENSHVQFQLLASFNTIEVVNPDALTVDGWGDASYYTYLLLKEGVDIEVFSKKITWFYEKYVGDLFKIWQPIYTYSLQPLTDIHLRSDLLFEIGSNGNMNQVYVFSAIGLIILLLAGINYMNLATARSINRAKEISVKKVVGAVRFQLISQYIVESILTALIAFALALLLSNLVEPLFSQVTGKDINLFSYPALIIFLAAVSVVLGILSSLYPALVVSSFKPSTVLKGSFKTGDKAVFLRKSLVVTQFTITLVLVIGIIVVNSQMKFIRQKDLGYNADALLFLRVHGNTDVIEGYEAFRNDLLTNRAFKGSTTSNSLPIGGLGTGGSETVDQEGRKIQVNTARLRVDPNYLDVYGIKILHGRSFKSPGQNDTIRKVIINEAAVKNFGWKDGSFAIGKPFNMGGLAGEIIAVVNDFHFNSLQQSIMPLAIYPRDPRFSRITLNMDMSQAATAIPFLEKTWKKHFPSCLFDYDFMDSQLGEQYRSEQRFSKIFLYFSVLSLLIACLGLYGLIAYAASQKTKEIGIRKVLGASVNGIAIMLSGDFIKLVLIAFIIATPIAWYIMNNWLQEFAYKTDIKWWMFGAAGIGVLLLALFTVSFQAIKAAIANPVKSLRSE